LRGGTEKNTTHYLDWKGLVGQLKDKIVTTASNQIQSELAQVIRSAFDYLAKKKNGARVKT